MKSFFKENGVWLGFVSLVILITIFTGGDFLSSRNLTNLMRQASINGILAGGMTLVILTGGIDLSIGSVVALCGVLVGISQVNWGWGIQGEFGLLMSFAISIVAGLAIGLINGSLISFLRIAPFVITLGMMVIARGLALIFSGGSSISPMGEGLNELASGYFSNWQSIIIVIVFLIFLILAIKSQPKINNKITNNTLKNKKIQFANFIFPMLSLVLFGYSFFQYKGFPNLALYLMITICCLWFVMEKSVVGRSIYAVGSNEKAAYWAGVSIKKITLFVYGVMGLLSGVAAVLLSGRLNGADPNAGQLFELDAIAAVVIGGTSLKGGVGSVIGSLVGALTIATLNNGMDLLGVTSFYQMVFKGLIIVLAVSLDRGQRT